jgi:hypothetical protein
MARRRYKRAAKALTQLSRGKQETKFAQIKAQNIRAGTEAALESMNKKFEMAGQALVTADALAQEYKTKGKVEKGVTSLAEAKGGDVSYKKTGLGDIFRGEGKLSEWGKETWTIGEDKAQYDRADILAWEEKGRKDLKWESVIGKEVTQYDNESGGMTKTRTKPTTPKEPKKYSITGESELYDQTQKDFKGEDVNLQDKYGEGWSYKKQRAIDKMPSQHQSSSRFSGEEILKRQVGANVKSANYSKISKAFKSEYGKDKSLMTGIKAYDIQHEEWKESQTKPIPKADDKDLEGVVVSSTAVQEDIKPESPLTEFGIKKSDTSAKDMAALITPKKSKDYWGERKGIDVWEKFKERRVEASNKKEIQSLISGDDYVSSDELAQNEKNDLQQKRQEEIVKSLDAIDYNAPSMDSDRDFVNAEGQTLHEYEGSFPEFKNMGGIMRTEGYEKGNWYPNTQSPGATGSSAFSGTADQNIGLMNTMVRNQITERSSLSSDWDFNKAQAGDYDSPERVFGEIKESGENVGQYTTYGEGGEVITGLHAGKNYYPPVNLKGQSLRKMWDTLDVGDWDDRDTLWNQYMAGSK